MLRSNSAATTGFSGSFLFTCFLLILLFSPDSFIIFLLHFCLMRQHPQRFPIKDTCQYSYHYSSPHILPLSVHSFVRYVLLLLLLPPPPISLSPSLSPSISFPIIFTLTPIVRPLPSFHSLLLPLNFPPSISLFIYLSIVWSIPVSLLLSLSLSILLLFIYLSIYLFIHLFIYLSLSLTFARSIFLSLYLFLSLPPILFISFSLCSSLAQAMDRNHQGVITFREMRESLEVVSVSNTVLYASTCHLIIISRTLLLSYHPQVLYFTI